MTKPATLEQMAAMEFDPWEGEIRRLVREELAKAKVLRPDRNRAYVRALDINTFKEAEE